MGRGQELEGDPVLYSVARRGISFLFRMIWRPRVVGLEHLPRTGAVILASNHLSFIDSVVIPLVVPRRVRFLAKAEYFEGHGLRGRGMAVFFRLVDAVPVRRDGQRDSMAALHAALEVLREGAAFGIYPEGTRSRDGRLYRGRTGVGWLALTSGVPVVPVALTGTDSVQPVGHRLPRIRPVRVCFGRPIDPDPWARRVAHSGGASRARREITVTVMDGIAAMSPQERAHAYNERSSDDADLE
jgi:1-acyl-sn-glycerol-3-phosphate acyltransferase